ncbi:tRNA (N(6)-L-threonylcarbamoyladenosine(37)-C(2))-methylthiotransferase MtaB [Eubacterium sp. AF19-12LB]|jgi:threonylcarbamoyladenosine tRNA methylthiotransferase MtaB|uniref:tRNA (N(6)-L-threonylcarbamoyladenosine(37)-C(2))- methylthiotransferase MtaB n=1 Tax=unclassified Eubacterium (in: firmicutes) TaxID=2624479 RepID=UPI0003409DD2|nr:tRNA (N(6)-L-threonylcarbamoyladenosine(37)-C(2))-methylthiotransferase MtaB [Eubacterium sp. AF19-12LB]MCJ7966788.1 tRNA (N(6)-L-threonylcarbamoyladenosine(37)-C(2))-methylthiotransferase MtaB [Lachnospiraceae bacterium NSJ-171]MEE0293397.1 tRNA (N(6)-L-threonylcarbamoyladenosine(37)-C(2))-methylthiotransferase MtaB [Eubacterium sp.]RHR35773.1 tRNA (N(6)-L-threonylcarbamoyladenosine(37)-C(2))-methylthiotransferase MtaB [Eubacterium sp. AF19-12LB]CDA29895.1 tRNA methylthiotransferase YqeV [E
MLKVALHNLGCKVNAYETEAMAQKLEDAGYEIVPFNEKADVYIINTCSVTNMADRKSRQMLHKAKKMNEDAVVVAAGCYVQTATEKLLEDLSVDILIGNNKKKDIVEELQKYFDDNKYNKNVIDINATNEYEELELATVTEHTRAYIKIQDGCNQFCSYCIIPYARGRIRSREFDNIKQEVTELAQKGFKEIVLTGIHLSSYGNNENKLIDVVEMIAGIEGVERIRLGSLEPNIVTEDFAKRLAKVDKICPHFHLSMQSGCDNTLKRMNRHYTSDEYFEKCELLRKYFDNPAFTTDVIVGFPGETQEDYEISREFVKKVRFSELHVFKYSKRDGTVAAKMENQIPEPVKTERSEDLIKVGENLTMEYRRKFIGKKVSVLFEEIINVAGENYWVGHTKEYIKVIMKSDKDISGDIKNVSLIGFANECLNCENIEKKGVGKEIMLATI